MYIHFSYHLRYITIAPLNKKIVSIHNNGRIIIPALLETYYNVLLWNPYTYNVLSSYIVK